MLMKLALISVVNGDGFMAHQRLGGRIFILMKKEGR